MVGTRLQRTIKNSILVLLCGLFLLEEQPATKLKQISEGNFVALHLNKLPVLHDVLLYYTYTDMRLDACKSACALLWILMEGDGRFAEWLPSKI